MIAKIDGGLVAIFHERGHREPGGRQPADADVKSELACRP